MAWSKVAVEALTAFLGAQKTLLDVLRQQVNVNLDAASDAGDFLLARRFLPMAISTGERVKGIVDAETSLLGSMFKPSGVVTNGKRQGHHKPRKHQAA